MKIILFWIFLQKRMSDFKNRKTFLFLGETFLITLFIGTLLRILPSYLEGIYIPFGDLGVLGILFIIGVITHLAAYALLDQTFSEKILMMVKAPE